MLCKAGRFAGAAALRVTVAVPLPLEALGTASDPVMPLERVGSDAVAGCGPTATVTDDPDEAAADGTACGRVVTPPPPPQAASAATAMTSPSPTKRLRTSMSPNEKISAPKMRRARSIQSILRASLLMVR